MLRFAHKQSLGMENRLWLVLKEMKLCTLRLENVLRLKRIQEFKTALNTW